MVSLPNFKEIDIGDQQIKDAGLRALAEHADKFKNLSEIWLSNNQITDAGLRALAEHADKF